jgi:hypothetical protein
MKIESKILRSRYDCVVGCGYYFSGHRIDKNGEEKPLNMDRVFAPLLKSLDQLRKDEKESGQHWLYILLNDCSPYDSPELGMKLKQMDSYIYIQPDENVGCGGKENILQAIGKEFAPYLFRVDADVELTNSILPLFHAMEVIPNLGAATINAGFMGGMITYANPGKLYVPTAQIGNAVIWKTAALNLIGLSNPRLRYFEDLDLVYKARHLGINSVMVTSVIGKTVSSGCGGTMSFELQQESAKLMVATNPLVSYSLNRKGKPIIRYNKYYVPGMFGLVPIAEPPSTVALQILKEIL